MNKKLKVFDCELTIFRKVEAETQEEAEEIFAEIIDNECMSNVTITQE